MDASKMKNTNEPESLNPRRLHTQAEAAVIVNLSEAWFERDRWAGPRIPYVKVGARAVRYRAGDLEDYLAGQTVMAVGLAK